MFSRILTKKSINDCYNNNERLQKEIETADAIIIGAGSGLSTSAGFTYSGERFDMYFHDFIEKYGFRDMYSGGFYPFENLSEHWAYWSRYIFINRYMDIPKPVYETLFNLVKDKDYFVLTTNVDHCFQKSDFAKDRLFYTQGDYGLFQCSEPCHDKTYENEDVIREMVKAQGFVIKDNALCIPEGTKLKMEIPTDLIPYCPHCHKPMSMNLRADETFVEDEGWHRAAERYVQFLQRYEGKHILFLELGVGGNTPGIIKYPFWQMTMQNKKAVYACINKGEAFVPKEMAKQSICIDGDIKDALYSLCKYESIHK